MTIQPNAPATQSTVSGHAADEQMIIRRKDWKTPQVIKATLSDGTEASVLATPEGGTAS